MRDRFARFFSLDSTKAVKAQGYGYMNAINYMAPHDSGGHGNLCSHASPGCIALCLGIHSGQAAMHKPNESNSVLDSRKRKVRYFMTDRAAFMQEAARHIAKQYAYATRKNMLLCVRMNGATDVAWESLRFVVDEELAAFIQERIGYQVDPGNYTLLSLFSFVQFVDYTKNHLRFNRPLPANLCLTFSRAENNDTKAIELLGRGVNVAVVFRKALPETWNGFTVIDGDVHDLRHLDPRGGYVVGLTPKGNKAKRDTSGFVVD